MKIPTIALALFALSMNAGLAAAQSADLPAGKISQPAALSTALQSGGRTRVIVELVDPPQSAAGDDSAAAQAAVSSLQTSVLSAAFGDLAELSAAGSPHALQRMTAFPMFAVNVDRRELDRLNADARVLRIMPDGKGRGGLNDSTKQIGMPVAWGAPYHADGRGRSVAILDSGVELTHKFIGTARILAQGCFSGGGSLSATMCPNHQFTQTTGNAGVACPYAWAQNCDHGTHVAGIAAGFNTDPKGTQPLRGIAFRARIIAVQVATKPTPLGGDWYTYWSDNIAALDWLYANRNRFKAPLAAINMSLWDDTTHYVGNCNADYAVFKSAIDRLYRVGIATVIIAGNGSQKNAVSVPGCISSAFTVGATTKLAVGKPDRIASYSDMGADVDVLAPGGDFAYPYPTGDRGGIHSSIIRNRYAAFVGTSMAAPHVVGAIAAIRSSPGCGNVALKTIEAALVSTGEAIHDQRTGGKFTKRRIAVDKALKKLNCTTPARRAVAQSAAH